MLQLHLFIMHYRNLNLMLIIDNINEGIGRYLADELEIFLVPLLPDCTKLLKLQTNLLFLFCRRILMNKWC